MLFDDNATDTASTHPEPATATVASPPVALPISMAEPFELFLRDGEHHHTIRFSIGDRNYEGSSDCEELDLAVMVARVAYVATRDALVSAGRIVM